MNNKHIISLVLIGLIAFSFGCEPKTVDPAKSTDLELQLEALMNNNTAWGLNGGTVVKDGFDVSSQFDGFALSIGEFTYTSQNSLNTAWPSAGSWEFINDNPNKILRSDGVEITVNITASKLVLSYTVSNIGGKASGINGNYEFTLTSN